MKRPRANRTKAPPMAELTVQERLQPALLDRLTDDEPDKTVESRDQRIIALPKLRQAILRDLSWLLNTPHLAATEDLEEYPFVAESVLNYGLPSFAGSAVARLSANEVERAIKQAILRFEPRLLEKSVKVKMMAKGMKDDASHAAQIEIEGELWAQPVPLRLFMKTEVDLEVGNVTLVERADRGRR
jgi:type VI secretion system protein ImpF